MDIEREYKGLEKKFFDLTCEVISTTNVEMYDMEFLKHNCTLVVYIMNPQTKTAVIEDCIEVDRAFSEPMEALEWIPKDIRLEVSSPGAYRKIRSREHFELALEEIIKVKLDNPLGGDLPKRTSKNHSLRGKLASVEKDYIELMIDESLVRVDFDNIKQVQLDPEF